MERNIQLNWQSLVIEAIKRRKEQNLTQEQLAVLAGVSKPTLNSFEQGKTAIKLNTALKILKILGLAYR
jgi:DNA-binding XRE family transcriptional regulator